MVLVNANRIAFFIIFYLLLVQASRNSNRSENLFGTDDPLIQDYNKEWRLLIYRAIPFYLLILFLGFLLFYILGFIIPFNFLNAFLAFIFIYFTSQDGIVYLAENDLI